jgi:uncharacterized membrane protein
MKNLWKILGLGVGSMTTGAVTCLTSSTIWLFVVAEQQSNRVCSMGGSDCSIMLPFMIVTAGLLAACLIVSIVGGIVVGWRRGLRSALALAFIGSALITNGFYILGYV